MAWHDTTGKFQSLKLDATMVVDTLAVAGRTIVASSSAGSLAAFPRAPVFLSAGRGLQ